MNASANFKEDFLKHLFQNADIAGIGDASGILGSAAAGNLFLRLCTDAVAVDADTLGTECAYTGYAALGVAVVRSAVGWTVTANVAENAAEILFGACTAGSENIQFVEVWKNNAETDIAYRIGWVELNDIIPVAPGSQPRFTAGVLTFTFN